MLRPGQTLQKAQAGRGAAEKQAWPQYRPLSLACTCQASPLLQALGSEPCGCSQVLLLSG